MNKKLTHLTPLLAIIILIGIVLYRGHEVPSREAFTLVGPTMGTQYHITVHGNLPGDIKKLQMKIQLRLNDINQSMSTWITDSEISKINRMPDDEWIPVSKEFNRVLQASMNLSKKTNGAFDITVGPLVNLWGFGPNEEAKVPSSAQIKQALNRIGYQNLEVESGRLKKMLPGMDLDFSAIAKGYGVDQIASLLEKEGIENYSVEIGGEIYVKGVNAQGEPWVVGIETPEENASYGADFITTVSLTHGALATSGSYRIFIGEGKEKKSHIINPKTGKALESNLVSVTVFAPTCMQADGTATALMVMGVDKGLKWVEERKDIEVLFVTQKSPGKYDQIMSSGFNRLIAENL